jgi:ABC-type multidrug transport system fused ATPase/permease subunit
MPFAGDSQSRRGAAFDCSPLLLNAIFFGRLANGWQASDPVRRVLGGKLKGRPPNAVAANEAGLAAFQAGAPMLRVRDLRTSILKPTSFCLSAGEALAVRGPSGAGKTLLLRAVADLDPNEGLVTLDGRDRSTIAGPEWRRLVGYVPAEPGWWADTVGEHFGEWTAALAFVRDLGFSAFPRRRRRGRSHGCRPGSDCGSHSSVR